ncbi:MAG: hypothetical protein ABMA26_05695 [Limisphaerales bacterium]
MTLGKFIRDQFKHRFDAGPFGRSLTIAHDLEDLCDVKAPEKKVKKSRQKEWRRSDRVGTRLRMHAPPQTSMSVFAIHPVGWDCRTREFFVFDEGEMVELGQKVHSFLIRLTKDRNASEFIYFMEMKLVWLAAGEWRLDQINHHETKSSDPKRFRGKRVPNELLPAVAERMGIIIRSSPPLSMVSSGAVWRTDKATQMWKHLEEHLVTVGSDYRVEHITTNSEDVFRLFKGSPIRN